MLCDAVVLHECTVLGGGFLRSGAGSSARFSFFCVVLCGGREGVCEKNIHGCIVLYWL